jgi:hypothetical protein
MYKLQGPAFRPDVRAEARTHMLCGADMSAAGFMVTGLTKIRSLLLAALGICMIQFAISCSVPVFRYALGRWKPDAYKAIYISDIPLNLKGLPAARLAW